jgi:small subunit ribosomal protein S16
MLAIRMQRNGRSHYPTYRIVVQESQRHPLSGRVVAEVGNYNPATKSLTLDKETVEKYLSNGAQPSTRVAYILSKNGVKLPKWVKLAPKKTAAAKHADKLRKNQPKEEPAAEPASDATEAPAEA